MRPSADLLRRCCRDDRRAHQELYQECFGFVLSVCRRYYVNREDAAAAINMIFLKMIRGMNTFLAKEKQVPFELWVRRIALNHVTDEFRKNKSYRDRFYELNSDDGIHDTPVHAGEFKNETLEQIQHMVGQLPPMGRTVFNLHVVDGFKHEEIARQLGISVNTSKVHLHRARKQLQEWIGSNQEIMH